MIKPIILLFLSAWLVACSDKHLIQKHEKSQFQIASIFMDNMVVQRDKDFRIWGNANSGQKLTIEFAGIAKNVSADDSGEWVANFDKFEAGGPYTLSVKAGDTEKTVANVMIGEVWLCAGQSNMARTVAWSKDIGEGIARTTNDNLRLLTVSRRMELTGAQSLQQQDDWKTASPKSIDEFSAVCYFFGREIQEKLNVPVGLIAASWGGSPIEAWMKLSSVDNLGLFSKEIVDIKHFVQEPEKAKAEYEQSKLEWWKINDPGTFPDKLFDPTSEWNEMSKNVSGPLLPWSKTDLKNFDGVVWYFNTFDISEEKFLNKARLTLGQIDDQDTTWINGIHIGTTDNYMESRKYFVPKNTLKIGQNIIAIRVYDHGGNGGFKTNEAVQSLKILDGPNIDLTNGWRRVITADKQKIDMFPNATFKNYKMPSGLYNGMLVPLTSMNVRGTLWYQGEQNARYPKSYETLLSTFNTDLKNLFPSDPAFLVIQLPQYNPPVTDNAYGNWAKIRAAQSAVADENKNVELIVTIDSGSRTDIHPQNKRLVASRAASTALATQYGFNIPYRGPQFQTVNLHKDRIEIFFKTNYGPLITADEKKVKGFEVCQNNTCLKVSAKIENSNIVISKPKLFTVTSIRYGWADAPNVNLTDASGFPVEPFQGILDRK